MRRVFVHVNTYILQKSIYQPPDRQDKTRSRVEGDSTRDLTGGGS